MTTTKETGKNKNIYHIKQNQHTFKDTESVRPSPAMGMGTTAMPLPIIPGGDTALLTEAPKVFS